MTAGAPLATIERPSTPGSRPYRDSHSPAPSTITAAAPGASSLDVKSRPSIGRVPTSANALAETNVPAKVSRRAAVAGHDDRFVVVGRQRLEAARARLPVGEVEKRHAEVRRAIVAGRQVDDTVGAPVSGDPGWCAR